jgi:hypothetical protein
MSHQHLKEFDLVDDVMGQWLFLELGRRFEAGA